MDPREHWDGFQYHPLLTRLTEGLESQGFGPMGFFDDGTGSYEWSKPAFEGYDFRILVMPETAMKGRISLSVGLSIESSRQAQVEELIGLSRCSDTSQIRTCVSILYVSLPWLMARWEPVAGPGREVFSRWKELPSDDCENAVEDMLRFLRSHGSRFFELVSSPERLADILRKLPDFPGRGSLPSGPLSSSPLEFSAVLLNDLKRPNEALECLQRDMDVARQKVSDGVWYEDDLRVVECRHGLYKQWIGGPGH